MSKSFSFYNFFAQVAQNLHTFAYVSVFKNIDSFHFYKVLKVLENADDTEVTTEVAAFSGCSVQNISFDISNKHLYGSGSNEHIDIENNIVYNYS